MGNLRCDKAIGSAKSVMEPSKIRPASRYVADNLSAMMKTSSSPLSYLAVTWSCIVLAALTATAATALSSFSSNDERLLRETAAEPYSFSTEHAPLFPLTTSDYLGCSFAIVGLMVAAGGGIGGGGILVPIFILVMDFSPKHAIPLSNITVLGGAFANALLNAKKRHPSVDRPLVDWDLILVMEPLTIASALVGAFLNKLLPETLLLLLLVVLLSFTAYTSLKKAIKMYAAESRNMRERGGSNVIKESELTKIVHRVEREDEEEAEESLLENMEHQEEERLGDGVSAGDEKYCNEDDRVDLLPGIGMNKELKQILDEEKVTPKYNVKLLMLLFVVVLIVNVVKGGGAFHSPLGIRCGSYSFWAANAFMIIWILVIMGVARNYLVDRYETKKRVGYKYAEGDIQWNSRSTVAYPCVCCLAGFFAGMFGVGGGIVKGPLMLAMGVHPAVSAATSACMILFTSFVATTSFIVFGLLIPDYAIVCFIIGFLATVVGQLCLTYLMRNSQRNSYIAFSIGGVVLLSAFLMTIQSMVSMAEGPRPTSSGGGICDKSY